MNPISLSIKDFKWSWIINFLMAVHANNKESNDC